MEGGVVPGGGLSFLTAHEELESLGFQKGDFGQGQRIVSKALGAPFRTIIQNAGVEPAGVLARLEEPRKEDAWAGWDANTEEIRDFGKDPLVLDPAKVNITALKAAASVVASLISVNVTITQAK